MTFLFLIVLASCGEPTSSTPEDDLTNHSDATSDVDLDERIVYVDGSVESSGDGSTEAPFATLLEALELEEPADRIIVAAGTYPTPTPWVFEHALIIEGGRGEPTILTPYQGSQSLEWSIVEASLHLEQLDFAVNLEVSGADLTVQHVIFEEAALILRSLTRAALTGVTFDRGEGLTATDLGLLELSQCELREVAPTGVHITNSVATLDQLTITDVHAIESEPEVFVGGDGLVVEGGTLTLTNSSIARVDDRGLVVTASAQATLSGTLIESGSRALLSVQQGASVEALDMSLTTGTTCAFVSDAALIMRESTVEGCSTSGLLTSANADITLSDMTFIDNPGGHIALFGDGVRATIETTTARNATASSCISITGTAEPVVLRQVSVENCFGVGIGILNATDVLLDDIDIGTIVLDPTFDVGEGLNLVDAEATLRDSTIHDTAGKGVAMIRSTATIEDNRIERTGDSCINLLDPGDETTTVTGNTLRACTVAGVSVFSASALVSQNIIEDVALDPEFGLGDGVVFVMGAQVSVTGNTISGSTLNGVIFTDDASGEIGGNTIRDSGQYGIREYCGSVASDVTIEGNTFENNFLGEVQLCN